MRAKETRRHYDPLLGSIDLDIRTAWSFPKKFQTEKVLPGRVAQSVLTLRPRNCLRPSHDITQPECLAETETELLRAVSLLRCHRSLALLNLQETAVFHLRIVAFKQNAPQNLIILWLNPRRHTWIKVLWLMGFEQTATQDQRRTVEVVSSQTGFRSGLSSCAGVEPILSSGLVSGINKAKKMRPPTAIQAKVMKPTV